MKIADVGLGDRMKLYETRENIPLLPLVPIVARVDGIGFSKFTKKMHRPYDERLHEAMLWTTHYLVQEFGANCGYTQSDEISLGWDLDFKSEIYGGNRAQKLVSHLAAKATHCFWKEYQKFFVKDDSHGPYNGFDARIWTLPNLTEASNAFLWREQDATRNSIQQATRAYYSHKECYHKNTAEMHEMLWEKGVNWNDYPNWFKRGTYILKRKEKIPFSSEEIERLPEKHKARANPDLLVERTVFAHESPRLGTLINRGDYLFNGAYPEYIDTEE